MRAIAARYIEKLIEALGRENVLVDPKDIAMYRRDGRGFSGLEPGAVALPATVEQVAETLRLANEFETPVIPLGGGYSLTGFPPVASGTALVLSMDRMANVISIDATNMTLTAECGIRMNSLEQFAAERGYEVDTVAVPKHQTTLGGVLSGVIGGGLSEAASVLGANAQSVIGLKVVLPTGRVLDTNAGGSNVNRQEAVIVDGDGPILTPLFLGDGGALGVKVHATLRLRPVASRQAGGEWIFPTFDTVWLAVSELRTMREVPYSALRVRQADGLWQLAFVCRTQDETLLQSRTRQIEGVLESRSGRVVHGGESSWPKVSSSDDAAADGDPRRTVVAAIFGNREFPSAFKRLRELLEAKTQSDNLKELGVTMSSVAFRPHTRHATYVTMSLAYDPGVAGGRTAAARLGRAGYRLVSRLGGHVEPLQGDATNIVAEGWSAEYRQLVGGLKRLVDPKGILNPGLWNLD